MRDLRFANQQNCHICLFLGSGDGEDIEEILLSDYE